MSLEDIREQKTSKGVYIVIGLLLIGMAGFGTSQFGTGSNASQSALLSTDDAEITMFQYNNAFRNVQQRNPDMDAAEVRQQVLSLLRQRLALADYIQRYPLAASNPQIDDAIRNDITFSENGAFSEEVFRRVIGVSPEIYRRNISNDIAMQALQVAVATTAVVSQAELQPFIELSNMSRDISVAKIARQSFTNTATDAEMENYYEANKTQYMTPEMVDIRYIDFNPSAIAETVVLNEQEMADLAMPDRQVDYLIFSDMGKAKEAYAAAKAGKTVENIKTDFIDAIEDSGDLGRVSRKINADSLIDQVATDAIFSLNAVGEVTQPMDTENGIMLFALTDIGAADAKTADDIAKAKAALQAEKAAPEITALGDKLNQAVFESGVPTLDSIAESTGLAIKDSGLQAMDGKQDILAIPEIVEAISNSDKKIGQLSEPVTLGERVIIYQLKALKAPEQQAISEVKPKLEQAVIAEKTDKQVAEAAKQLIENSKTGGLDKAAKAAGYPYQSFADFKGQPGDSTLLDPVAALLIARQPPRLGNDNAQEIRSPTGDVYVYVTNKVELGNSQSQENAQMTSQLTATLNEQIGRLELDEFIQSITERADITDHSNTLLAQ